MKISIKGFLIFNGRQYTKWDTSLKTNANVGLVLQRAFRIAASEPCGAVYVTMPREVLMERLPGGQGMVYSDDKFTPAITPQGDSTALREAAKLLVEARNPVVSVKRMGRNPRAVSSLVRLAEKLALPVIRNDSVLL